MLLWIIFALMTSAVLIAVLAPLARPLATGAAPGEAADAGALEVYRHQLDEIEAERARGTVEAAEADAARIEVSRRLLASAAASERAGAPGAAQVPTHRMPLAVAAAAFVTLASLAVYLVHGAPDLPSFPHAQRTAGPLVDAPLGQLIAKVEARLREQPQDGDGWDVIGPVYLKLERFRDAANAFARAAELKGETVKRLRGLAEASVLAADGIVTEDARLAYQKILKQEPGHTEARFWLALAREQDGKLAEAVAEYTAMLAAAPADAPWRASLEQRIADLTRRVAAPGKDAPRGPSAADVAAAQKLSEDERAQMIAGMVDGLAQRLERDGKDLAGWLRLVNAYVVLGREGEARTALAKARKQLTGDDKALAELAALAKRLGLGS